jgi:hypothetical protein
MDGWMRWDAYTLNFLTFKVIECHWYIKINVTYTLKNRYENKISYAYILVIQFLQYLMQIIKTVGFLQFNSCINKMHDIIFLYGVIFNVIISVGKLKYYRNQFSLAHIYVTIFTNLWSLHALKNYITDYMTRSCFCLQKWPLSATSITVHFCWGIIYTLVLFLFVTLLHLA